MKAIAVVVPLLLLTAFANAQQQPYIETFEVRLHNLDVVVTDPAGKAVRGLTKDDFVVLEEGAAQEITNFAEYSESEGSLATPAKPAIESAPRTVRPPRRFVFFIDEMSLHPVTRKKILKNAVALLEKSMWPGDEALVVRPVGEENVVQTFTDDIDTVVRALQKALDENGTRIDTQAANELRFLELQLADSALKQERQHARRIYADMVRRRVEQRLGQLRALVASFAGTEGKKILVLIGTTLQAEPGREVRDPDDDDVSVAPENEVPSGRTAIFDLRPRIAELAATAAANGVTIYTLQADVPYEYVVPGREAPRRQLATMSASPVQAPTRRAVLPSNVFETLITGTETTMKSLAEKTGGRAFRGDGRIDDVFKQVGDDLTSYYSLAYHAKGEPGSRRIEVRVKDRPELRVRTRTGVFEKSPSREMEDLTVASLMYPRTVNELAIRAVPGTMKKDRNLFTVPVETQIPLERLTFLPGPDGKYHGLFSVHYAASGEKSDFASGQSRRQEITITEEEFRALAGKVFRFTSNLVVAPGHVKIAVGVLDHTSKLSGFATIRVWAR